MNKTTELLLQIENFSKNRGFGRIFWITQILAGFMGLSVLLFLAINTLFHIDIFAILLLPIFILWIISLILDTIGWVSLSKILASIKNWNMELWKIQNKVEEPWEILDICNTLFRLVQKLSKFLYFVRVFYPRKIQSYHKIFSIQYTIILAILTDLRSDLATRIAEQQQILEWAKSEVERNLTGTPELLAVSEAQKLRLDRQIEQFEELQRVLVKV
jgi:hypothetical protein